MQTKSNRIHNRQMQTKFLTNCVIECNVAVKWLGNCLHFFVVWIFGGATSVADFSAKNAIGCSEQSVSAPEAAHSKSGRLIFNIDFMHQIWACN